MRCEVKLKEKDWQKDFFLKKLVSEIPSTTQSSQVRLPSNQQRVSEVGDNDRSFSLHQRQNCSGSAGATMSDGGQFHSVALEDVPES